MSTRSHMSCAGLSSAVFELQYPYRLPVPIPAPSTWVKRWTTLHLHKGQLYANPRLSRLNQDELFPYSHGCRDCEWDAKETRLLCQCTNKDNKLAMPSAVYFGKFSLLSRSPGPFLQQSR